MKIYDCLTAEEVAIIHRFYTFLRKVGASGLLKTNTQQFSFSESGKPIRYKLTFAGYDSSLRGKLTPDEQLAEILMKAKFLESCIQQTE